MDLKFGGNGYPQKPRTSVPHEQWSFYSNLRDKTNGKLHEAVNEKKILFKRYQNDFHIMAGIAFW